MRKKIPTVILLILVVVCVLFGVYATMYGPSRQRTFSPDISVTVTVGNSHYGAAVPGNATVYDVMNTLASTTPFRFTSKLYPGLGFFIEGINGVSNKGGSYWTLYVNDLYAPLGASQYVLKNNDEIEWKFEHN